ncbi:MAG: hypothetical protein KatS3mg016_1799 [Fimbriimonadales bacterium]|nr:MAG: hypothetical protein KatS3mg016_1799 [Fimbriimonadales bacterium]
MEHALSKQRRKTFWQTIACSVWRVFRRWLLSLSGKHLIWTTQGGVEIAVERGSKPQSPHDFVVKFRDPNRGGRWRTPKHIHLIVELYVKEAYDAALTYQLRDYLVNLFQQIQPISSYPPRLQVYKPGNEQQFARLDAVGEFSVEFLLVVSELIFIQEKTNYPGGSLTLELYKAFGKEDRFSVINRATFRG